MNIIKKYFKLFIILVLAYALSSVSIKYVFLSQSPKINPFFTQNMVVGIKNIWLNSTNYIASLKSNSTATNKNKFNEQDIVDALNIPLNKISQGVYAGEKNNIKVIEIRNNEIDYIEYTFYVNGKEIKLNVVKGDQPPSQKVVEAVYK